jgi:hypothetical protein
MLTRLNDKFRLGATIRQICVVSCKRGFISTDLLSNRRLRNFLFLSHPRNMHQLHFSRKKMQLYFSVRRVQLVTVALFLNYGCIFKLCQLRHRQTLISMFRATDATKPCVSCNFLGLGSARAAPPTRGQQ